VSSTVPVRAYCCGHDGHQIVASDVACPICGRVDLEADEVDGVGKIVVMTRIHVAPTRYSVEAPYTVVLVEFDARLRVMGRLIGDSGGGPGARVRLRGCDRERGPMFELL